MGHVDTCVRGYSVWRVSRYVLALCFGWRTVFVSDSLAVAARMCKKTSFQILSLLVFYQVPYLYDARMAGGLAACNAPALVDLILRNRSHFFQVAFFRPIFRA